ncbi:hypothetical protein ACFQ61_16710 [Streptomyces sp. NPDC056500]|uniref:hypothetical protein n=1 Tax=Streptomyces sp. NPDC056500 TaxID=3345840 RepID=UPI0036A749BD
MRRITAACGTALAISATTLIAAPTAQAAEVDLKSSTWSSQSDGKVHVSFEQHDTTYRPEDVTIRIRKNGSEDVLSSLKLRNTDSCSVTYDCWDMHFSTGAVTLPDMGVYTLDVVVREGQQNELVDRDNGVFNYVLDPKLTVEPERPWVSFDTRTVQVSGSLVAKDPNTLAVKPFPGASVSSRQQFHSDPKHIRTDENGRFTARYDASHPTDMTLSYYIDSASEQVVLPLRQQALKIALTTPTGTISAPYGSDVPVRGSLKRIADDGREKPLEGAAVTIAGQQTVQTQRDGSFAGALSVTQKTTARVTASLDGWFTPVNQTFAEVAKPKNTTTFSPVSASVDKYRKVTFSGKLGVTEGSYPAGTTATVAMEHSTDGRTWKSTGTFTAPYGSAFRQSPPQKATGSSHWRLHHTRSGVTSKPVKLGRKSTMVWNEDFTPEGVRKGATITAKGGLVQYSGSTWKPYAGQTVRIYFKPATRGGAWRQLGMVKTLSSGNFSRQFKAVQDGTWQVRYVDTASTHYADNGREDFIDVR